MTPPHLLSIRKVQSRPQDSSVETSVNEAELWTPRTAHRQCKPVRGTPELGPGLWRGRVLLGLLRLSAHDNPQASGNTAEVHNQTLVCCALFSRVTVCQRPAHSPPSGGGGAHLSEQRHAYLRDFCKLSIGLTALLSRFHGNSVVVHKGPVHTQLAGLQGGRKRVWDRCRAGVGQVRDRRSPSLWVTGFCAQLWRKPRCGRRCRAAGNSAPPRCHCLPPASPPHALSTLSSSKATR